MPRTKSNIPANESNSQKFIRIANHRVNGILRSLKMLAQLGGTNYSSTPEQRKMIASTLTEAVTRTMSSMERGESVQEFKLK